MPYFITIQYPYNCLTITLSQNNTIVTSKTITKFQALSLLIPTLQEIFDQHHITLSDIQAIGINNGPGPFNTLRSIIATVNAFAFTIKIPLIECNGLDVLLHSCLEKNTVALLDAFGQEAYFAHQSNGTQGYNSIEAIVATCNQLYADQPVHYIGNGATKYKEYIIQNFQGLPIFHDEIQFADNQNLVNAMYEKYQQNQTSLEIYPLYFESPVVK